MGIVPQKNHQNLRLRSPSRRPDKAALVFGWHQGRRAAELSALSIVGGEDGRAQHKTGALDEMAEELNRKLTETANLNQHVQDLRGHLANAQLELLHAMQQERAKAARLHLQPVGRAI